MKKMYILLFLMALLLGMGMAYGKYVTTAPASGTVTFAVSLLEEGGIFLLQEHAVIRNHDGSYTLDTVTTTSGIVYELIPGLDIPKDPHIVISGKNPIPALLYLTVKDTTSSALTYTLEDCWKKTDEENVYIYSALVDGHYEPVAITSDYDKIPIIENNTVEVSQTLLSTGAPGKLEFSAELTEITN